VVKPLAGASRFGIDAVVQTGDFACISCSPPRFSSHPVRGWCRKCPCRTGIIRRRGAARDDHDPAAPFPKICIAPQYIYDELLRAEGFTEIRRVPDPPVDTVARGEVEFHLDPAAWSSLKWMPASR
jgi:hypothetical protein